MKTYFQLIITVSIALIGLCDVQYVDHLLDKRVENAPDEAALFAFGELDVASLQSWISTLVRKSDF